MNKNIKNLKILNAMSQMMDLFDNDEALMENGRQHECEKCKYRDIEDNGCPCMLGIAINELRSFIANLEG